MTIKSDIKYLRKEKESKKELTLGENAELWWKAKGMKVPKKNTKEWKKMYAKWVNYAFQKSK